MKAPQASAWSSGQMHVNSDAGLVLLFAIAPAFLIQITQKR